MNWESGSGDEEFQFLPSETMNATASIPLSPVPSFSISWVWYVLLVVAILLAVGVMSIWFGWFASSSSSSGKTTRRDRHLVVKQEEADTFFAHEGATAETFGEMYLTDNVDDIIEDLELEGVTPTEKQVHAQLQNNRAENMQRLKRNLESKWRAPIE